MKALSPEGAPIAWFPPRMKLFFANRSIDKATVRAGQQCALQGSRRLAEWTKHVWQIDLPQTISSTTGKAIADLENTEPLAVSRA